VKSIDTGADLVGIVVDESTGYLGANVNAINKYRIYDLNSGNMIKEISLSEYSVPAGMPCYLVNSYLVSRLGYYKKVEL
jgi:hypothetical protein